MGGSCNGYNLCALYDHVPAAAEPHIRCCGLTWVSEWTRREHASFQVAPDYRPQLLDDMLLLRDGMMGNWTFPKNRANVYLISRVRAKTVNTTLTYLTGMTDMHASYTYAKQTKTTDTQLVLLYARPTKMINFQCFLSAYDSASYFNKCYN